MSNSFDALLVVSFGGPEKREDVVPFLDNVLRGRNVPEARKLEVAEHYYRFDGKSPINDRTRALIAALEEELKKYEISLPVYWGNRNWHPFLKDAVRQMADDGVKNSLAFVVSAFSSYSGCRQYLENIEAAREEVGEDAPAIAKLRMFYNHPGFIAANADRLRSAMKELASRLCRKTQTRVAGAGPQGNPGSAITGVSQSSNPGHPSSIPGFTSRPKSTADPFVAFTAHSIPMSMATHCDYERQLRETCRLVAEELDITKERWELVYQSRSGRPQDPWLEPDICQFIESKKVEGQESLVVMPIGFLSDHLEVLFDLDEEARKTAEELGISFVRAGTVGTHPLFVNMLVELIRERQDEALPQRAIGSDSPHHETCPSDCCPDLRHRP